MSYAYVKKLVIYTYNSVIFLEPHLDKILLSNIISNLNNYLYIQSKLAPWYMAKKTFHFKM